LGERLGRLGEGLEFLELDLASFFDEGADEDFGVAVYGGYDGGGHGLGEGGVCDLCLVGLRLVGGFGFVEDGKMRVGVGKVMRGVEKGMEGKGDR